MAAHDDSTNNESTSGNLPAPTNQPTSELEGLSGESLTEVRIYGGIRRTVNKLKEIRMSRGMTIAQVARYMGVDKSVVSKFENGPADPRLSTLLRYAWAVRAVLLVHPVAELDTSVLDGLGAKLRLRHSGQPPEPDDSTCIVCHTSDGFIRAELPLPAPVCDSCWTTTSTNLDATGDGQAP